MMIEETFGGQHWRGDGVEIREVPGVCQLVIIDDGILLFRKNVANEIGTDESSATSH